MRDLRNAAAQWRSWLFLVIALLVWSSLCWYARMPLVGIERDDGQYVVAAEAIAQGKGFVLPSRPDEPRPKYPAGLPAVLAATFQLQPGPFTPQKMLNTASVVILAFGWAFAVCTFFWLRSIGARAPEAAFGAAAAAYLSTPHALHIMADLALCAVAMALILRWQVRPSEGAEVRAAFIDGLLCAAAFLLRRQGIALLPALMIVSWQRKRRWGAMLSAALGFALIDGAGELYMSRFPQGAEDYLKEAIRAGWSTPASFAAIVLRNAGMLLTAVPKAIIPLLSRGAMNKIPAPAYWIIIGAFWLMLIFGAYRIAMRLGKRLLPAFVFAVGTLAIALAWPWPVGDRIIAPLVPLAIAALACGGASLASVRRARDLERKPAGVVLAALCIGALVVSAWSTWTREARLRADIPPDSVLQFIRNHTEQRSVIVTAFPELFYLYTGRQTVQLLSSVELWFQPERVEDVEASLSPVRDRPLYLIGSCGGSGNPVAEQTRAIAGDPNFSASELFRTPDCRYWIGALAFSGGTPPSSSGNPAQTRHSYLVSFNNSD